MRYGGYELVVALFVGAWIALGSGGCLSEQSFPMPADQIRRLTHIDRTEDGDFRGTRAWLRSAHRQLADLLPRSSRAALLSDDLTDGRGTPVDVFGHFGIAPQCLRKLLGNFDGMRCTAQGASQTSYIDKQAPAWPGFENVWIPIQSGLSLAGRLGLATDDQGNLRTAVCIVILPGFLGDNGVQRTCDLARFLVDAGYHVLAVELRGHGQTEAVYPQVCYTFGVRETDDLMRVSDWLTALPHVEGTGLIGYCWGANLALLVGWYDGHHKPDPSISPTLAKRLPTKSDRARYSAGIMAFSPILRWEVLEDELETHRPYWRDPVYAAIQQTVLRRMKRKNYPIKSGDLRQLIEYEYAASDLKLPGGTAEGHVFLRLRPYMGKPAHNKLQQARTPVLIVQGCDDPLSPAQDVADFFADLSNPLVAGIILPGGGHVGFAAYAKHYYYSLIANFFEKKGAGLLFRKSHRLRESARCGR